MGNWESGMHYLLALSILVVLHAAYSAAEWRARRKHEDPGEQEEDLPLDIVLQTLIGLASAMVGVVHVSGSFKEIRATVELAQRNWENTRNRSSFYIFNHRGKAFSPHYEPPPSRAAIRRNRPYAVTEIPQRFLS
ncbi:ER membrane protein complex subunit 5-B [Lepeophtheirus salmonis]|uniref:Membrane magnesium transporter n=1 Tax=Lepeophtheirus salmonis TaxID=72036 RepID=A0A0K2SY49_LEPSM|nr:ER membrane protein complex subunit 5-B-like [Lepeophtheirus salmonis]